MKKNFFILFLLSVGICNHVHSKTESNSISVSGYAESFITPNIAKISFSISKTRSSLDSAQKYTSKIVGKTLKLLNQLEINKKQISTTGTSVNPVYNWNSSQEKQELLGFSVKREIRVELNDLAKLGHLMEEVGKLGITHITSPRFDSSERKKMQNAIYELAFLDAKEKANLLAKIAGRKLGGVITIEAKPSNTNRPIPFRNRSVNILKNESKETNYIAGDITLSARVDVKFRLN